MFIVADRPPHHQIVLVAKPQIALHVALVIRERVGRAGHVIIRDAQRAGAGIVRQRIKIRTAEQRFRDRIRDPALRE